MQVSNASDYFPGTECRVVAISGAMPTVAKAVSAILQEVFQDAERLNAQVPKFQTLNPEPLSLDPKPYILNTEH